MAAEPLISDRYELGDRLGSGGMSTVYKATDRVLERTVAVKLLAEHLSDDEQFVARFRREALAVAKLIHPNIVQVFDSGVDDGPPLHRHGVRRGQVGRADPARTGALERRATRSRSASRPAPGLDYAHRQGIIHRDVKPGNLMVIGGPRRRHGREMRQARRLRDRPRGRADPDHPGRLGVGTAAYLAPEQARGEEATPAADVYALGVVALPAPDRPPALRGLVAGRARDPPQNERPLPPTLLRRRDPRGARDRGAAALESDPRQRYASAARRSPRGAARRARRRGRRRSRDADAATGVAADDTRRRGALTADEPRQPAAPRRAIAPRARRPRAAGRRPARRARRRSAPAGSVGRCDPAADRCCVAIAAGDRRRVVDPRHRPAARAPTSASVVQRQRRQRRSTSCEDFIERATRRVAERGSASATQGAAPPQDAPPR